MSLIINKYKKMDYKEYLNSEHWKSISTKKKKNKKCAICHSDKNLDTHHLLYKNLYNVGLRDLRVVCRKCHCLLHYLHKNGFIIFKGDKMRYTAIKMGIIKYFKLGSYKDVSNKLHNIWERFEFKDEYKFN